MISLLSKVKEQNDELPKFLVDEISEMMLDSKKQIECPVCYLPIKNSELGMESYSLTDEEDADSTEYAEGLVITWCGHKLCRSCYSNSAMKKCPSCRTPFTKKIPK